MEPPECPVCLQPYDGESTVPRVLACGHSACESCLSHLHLHLHLQQTSLSPHTIRCPACTQLVKFPHPQGPTLLPKNIDLLRFSLYPSNNPTSPVLHNKDKDIKPQRRRFVPGLWSEELYAAWKDWILPNDVVSVEYRDEEVGICSVIEGRITIGSGSESAVSGLSVVMLSLLRGDQMVGLVKIGRFELNNGSVFDYSYVGKVMSVLTGMEEEERAELGSILRMSLRNCRICALYGLWLDEENGCLFLISERKNDYFLQKFNLGTKGAENEENLGLIEMKNCTSYLPTICAELCETLLALELEGIVCGCLGSSSFRFDDFGHVHVDLNEVLVMGRKVRMCVDEVVEGRKELDDSNAEELAMNLLKTEVFVSPELLFELLHKDGIQVDFAGSKCAAFCSSDVWLLGCLLQWLLVGKQFRAEMSKCICSVVFQTKNGEQVSACRPMYLELLTKMTALPKASVDVDFRSLQLLLLRCLDFEPGNRPALTVVWKNIHELIKPHIDYTFSSFGESTKRSNGFCLLLGKLCRISTKIRIGSRVNSVDQECDNGGSDSCPVENKSVPGYVAKGLSDGKVRCKELQGHLDCVTGLAIAGGFLFSSSFDKTVNTWSLKDFTLVHTFRGHEHKVMAVVAVDDKQPLCISGDSGGGIFIWEINQGFGRDPLKKWYEEKDWRYSGIHALAVSRTGYLYTGSGDRLIKAWSLTDYVLSCTMEGHTSVVSTLAVCNGVLYSGGWDGTVRMWSLHDHSSLGVLGDDMPRSVSSILSLHVDQHRAIAAYDNGCLKIWMNDTFRGCTQVHNGAIFALAVEEKWLFTGGWDRTLKFQEIAGDEFQMDVRQLGLVACDSVVTALLYAQGKLFAGCANKLIKVLEQGP